ncbi:MAG: hypothetical protein ACK5PZ_19625, partial [Pirellula sp.]
MKNSSTDKLVLASPGCPPEAGQNMQQKDAASASGLGARLGVVFSWPWLPWALCLAYYVAQPPLQWPLGAWISCVLFAIGVHQRDHLHSG